MKHPINDLNGQNDLNLPIDPDVLFSDHKRVFKPAIEKRQRKLLKKVEFLQSFLWEGETILCVTPACSPMTLLEQYLMGWLIFYIKRCLLVFTNMRILHIPTTADYSYRNSIAQMLYADCQSVAVKGGTLVVKYANGSKEKFYYVAGQERKKVRSLLETAPLQSDQGTQQARTHLCPRCTGELVKDQYTCPSCGLAFKSRAEARKIALVYPGGGYFYTRHLMLGVGDAFVEAMLTFALIASVIDSLGGSQNADPAGVLIFGAVLALEKAVSVYDSNKFVSEYIPVEKQIAPLPVEEVAEGADGFSTESLRAGV